MGEGVWLNPADPTTHLHRMYTYSVHVHVHTHYQLGNRGKSHMHIYTVRAQTNMYMSRKRQLQFVLAGKVMGEATGSLRPCLGGNIFTLKCKHFFVDAPLVYTTTTKMVVKRFQFEDASESGKFKNNK